MPTWLLHPTQPGPTLPFCRARLTWKSYKEGTTRCRPWDSTCTAAAWTLKT